MGSKFNPNDLLGRMHKGRLQERNQQLGRQDTLGRMNPALFGGVGAAAAAAHVPVSTIAQLVTALGGDSKVFGIYDGLSNVAGGATVSAWDDARGAAGYGPQLVGQKGAGAYPSYDAVNGVVSTDGSQNWLQTAAATAALDLTTDGRTLILIGAHRTANTYSVLIQDATATRYVAIGGQADLALATNLSGGSYARSGIAAAATKRVIIASSSASPNLSGADLAAGTTNRPWLGIEVPGFPRVAIEPSGGPHTAGNNYLAVGKVIGAATYCATDVVTLIVLNGTPSGAGLDAILEWAALRGVTPSTNAKKACYCVGDSLTYGTNATNVLTTSYPAVLAGLLGTGTYDTMRWGISGRFAKELAALEPGHVAQQGSTQRTKNWVWIWAGTNDVAHSESAATTIGYLQTIASAAKARGMKVGLITMINRTDVSGAKATEQGLLNAWLTGSAVSGGYADVVYDAHADSRLSNTADATYFNADGIHLTDAGYNIVANGVYSAMSAVGA